MSKLDQLRAMREAGTGRKASKPNQKKAPSVVRRDDTRKPESTGRDALAQSGATFTKIGRPRIEDRDKTLTARKPWEALGMSRATWYKRQAEKRT